MLLELKKTGSGQPFHTRTNVSFILVDSLLTDQHINNLHINLM